MDKEKLFLLLISSIFVIAAASNGNGQPQQPNDGMGQQQQEKGEGAEQSEDAQNIQQETMASTTKMDDGEGETTASTTMDDGGLKPGDCVEHCAPSAGGEGKGNCHWECPLLAAEGSKFRLERVSFNPIPENRAKCEGIAAPSNAIDGEYGAPFFALQFCAIPSPDHRERPFCGERFVVCFDSFLDPFRTRGMLLQKRLQVGNEEEWNWLTKICNERPEATDDELAKWTERNSPNVNHGFQVRAHDNGKDGGYFFVVESTTTKKRFFYNVSRGNCLRILLFADGETLFNARFYAINSSDQTVIDGPLPISFNGGGDNALAELPNIAQLANGLSLFDNDAFHGPWLLGMDMLLRVEHPFYFKHMLPTKNGCHPKIAASVVSNWIRPVRKCIVQQGGNIGECQDHHQVDEDEWEVMANNGSMNIGPNEQIITMAVLEPNELSLIVNFQAVPEECWNDMGICKKNPNAYLVFTYNKLGAECQIRIGRTRTHACILVDSTDTGDTFELGEMGGKNEAKGEGGGGGGEGDGGGDGAAVDEDGEEQMILKIEGRRVYRMKSWTDGGKAIDTGLELPEKCAVKNMPMGEFGMVFGATRPFVLQFTAKLVSPNPKCENALAIQFTDRNELLTRRGEAKSKNGV